MNLNHEKYKAFALCREMLETADVVKKFSPSVIDPFATALRDAGAFFLTGEGSSRIFPAKRAIYEARRTGFARPILTEGATQAQEYQLDQYAVLGASNSGRTKELIRLFTQLKKQGHKELYGVTAHAGSTLESVTAQAYVLGCGNEVAVAATKSVVEQALFFQGLFGALDDKPLTQSGLAKAGEQIAAALTLEIDPALTQKITQAGTIYFAGRNNGVAEELTLKTNEITRKGADFLEGTYAAHGIEEVMNPEDVLIVIDPFEEEEEKFSEVLEQGVGMTIIAIADRKTRFPTVTIPSGGDYRNYVELAAGWNLLVETGLALGIDLDKPVRARKVGNEFVG